jgi:CheY-like chemotaxis protein/anti-sigma regulatory factor (Ser/Thr protein kinase)
MSSTASKTIAMTREAATRTVLIVDDNPMDRHLAGRLVERQLGWHVEYANDGREALGVLDRSSVVDAILTDLYMPEMDGLQLVEAVRERKAAVPVVLMTGRGNEETALRALRAGAASYVPKKKLADDLTETLDLVVAVASHGHRRQRLLAHMTHTVSNFVLDNDRSLVPALVTMLQDMLCGMHLVDESERLRVGVALEEALVNALFHGNLGVSSDLKQQDDRAFHRLAEQRRDQPPYRDRRIYVTARLTPGEAEISVRDEGDGFDPATLPDPTDPANMERASGRGLLLIRTFMDEVRHNPAGNQITMVKRRRTG